MPMQLNADNMSRAFGYLQNHLRTGSSGSGSAGAIASMGKHTMYLPRLNNQKQLAIVYPIHKDNLNKLSVDIDRL